MGGLLLVLSAPRLMASAIANRPWPPFSKWATARANATAATARDPAPLRLRRRAARFDRRRHAVGQRSRRLGPRLCAAVALGMARLHADGSGFPLLSVHR